VSATMMDRIYLYVAPEEYAEAKASGAHWDDDSKRWYIRSDMAQGKFSQWLEGEEGETEFGVESEEALVAAARLACVNCRERIEVICICGERGLDVELGEPLTRFVVSHVGAADEALTAQLAHWPFFRRSGESEGGSFGNYCPHCGALQDDMRLHSEPGDVFFGLSLEDAAEIEFTPLQGRVRLSGDLSFEV